MFVCLLAYQHDNSWTVSDIITKFFWHHPGSQVGLGASSKMVVVGCAAGDLTSDVADVLSCNVGGAPPGEWQWKNWSTHNAAMFGCCLIGAVLFHLHGNVRHAITSRDPRWQDSDIRPSWRLRVSSYCNISRRRSRTRIRVLLSTPVHLQWATICSVQ